jgi:hypothetical protein
VPFLTCHATISPAVSIIDCQPASAELLIVDVSGDTPKGLTKTLTDRFGHTAAMFGASGRSLYRLAEGYLMRGRFEHGTLAERPVLAVAQAQTRIDVAPEGERVFGYFRIAGDELPQYQYWLLVDDARSDLPLPPLEAGEALLEANAKFARDTVLIARRTLLAGAERVRLEEVDPSGKLLISVLAQPDDFTPLDAHAYGRGMVLHATDTGIVQKRLDTGVTKTFSGTESAVKRGDALHPFERGLLVISEKRISYVTV